ncbi:MAG TPA: FAD-dependent oxidoreductase [Longimicrobiales bacterium]
MSAARHPDVLVIGAGIVGAACAYEFAREGLDVAVLDAGFAGGGTTAAGMGHLVVMDDSEAQFALTAYSRRLWEERAEDLPAECEFDRCGTLWVAEDDAQMEAVRAKHDAYVAHGIAAEVLDGRAVAECEPELRAPLAGGLRVPGDRVLYPPAAARHFLERARECGAEVRERCRVSQIRDGGVLLEEGGRLDAGAVVNAAGAEAARLVPALPIVPRKGHLVITDRYPGFCRHQLVELGYLKSAHVMSAESVAFNVQPRATGQLLIGSSRELVGWDASLNRDIVRQMLRRAIAFLPRLGTLSGLRTWNGFRPATPDKLPIIGRWDETEGLWIAAGHEGLGITTALGTARILADLLLGRTPEIDAAPFAPARFAAQAAS